MGDRGFTLIEVLIATALGAVVIGAAIAGVRVAAQCVAASTRLEVDSALMREGCRRAFADVDWWTDCDVPGAYEPMRALTADGRGMAFTPLSATFPRGATADGSEDSLAYDGSPAAWAVNDPRTWLRGSLIERPDRQPVDVRFGRYAMFSNVDSDPVLGPIGGTDYGGVHVDHTWLARQQRALQRALGWFGFLEYLPPNMLFTWYQPADGGTTLGGIPLDLVRNQDGAFAFNNSNQGSRGRYRESHARQFVVPSPHAAGRDLGADHYTAFNASFAGDAGSMADFDRATTTHQPLIPLAPATWSRSTVAVSRYIMNGRAAAICRVRWVNPLDGQSGELSFSTWGTTLRGARQQRAHPDVGGGWAPWHDDGTPAIRTLDSP